MFVVLTFKHSTDFTPDFFFLLGLVVIDMNAVNSSDIKDNGTTNLYDNMSVRLCNFNSNGELILFCDVRELEDGHANLVYVYSIQKETKTKKCRNLYMAPKEAEVLTITENDKIWLRIKDHIYVWNLRDARTTLVLDNIDVSTLLYR